MFYESAEKKIEVRISNSAGSLRDIDPQYWHELVSQCNASVIAFQKHKDVDTYLLSESSLFVWDKHFLIITCGQTTLINALIKYISDFGHTSIESVIFTREKELKPTEQATCFKQDIQKLTDLIPLTDFTANTLTNINNNIYCLFARESNTYDTTDYNFQLHELSGQASELQHQNPPDIFTTRDILKINQFFSGYKLQDHLFSPYGYSLNAVNNSNYITIHITPQSCSSYLSVKTNIRDRELLNSFQHHLINTFEPEFVTSSSFNNKPIIITDEQEDLTLVKSEELNNGSFHYSIKSGNSSITEKSSTIENLNAVIS